MRYSCVKIVFYNVKIVLVFTAVFTASKTDPFLDIPSGSDITTGNLMGTSGNRDMPIWKLPEPPWDRS